MDGMWEPSGEVRDSGTQLCYKNCGHCPGQWKVYLNPDTGAWICFKCGAKGRTDVGPAGQSVIAEMLAPRWGDREWPEMGMPEYEPLTKMARHYLKTRGIAHPEKYGIVSLAGGTRVLIPYRGTSGKIIYWTTRSFMDDGKPKYITAPGRHPLYVLPDWRKHDRLLIVEGVFDAIVAHERLGRPVVALGGKSVPKYLEPGLFRLMGDETSVMLDGDALVQGLQLAVRLGIKLETLPAGEDPASYYSKGDGHEG